MNKIFRKLIYSLFAPVTAKRGAFASSLGIILGLLPFYGIRIPLLFALSIVFRLNIVALLMGMIIPIFIPFFKSIAFVIYQALEGYSLSLASIRFWLFTSDRHVLSSPFYSFLSRLITGILFAIILFPVFLRLYNSGGKNHKGEKEGIFVDPSRRRWIIIKRMGIGLLAFFLLITVSFIESINQNPIFPDLQLKKDPKVSFITPIAEKISDQKLVKQLKLEEQHDPTIQVDYKKHNQFKPPAITGGQEVYGFYVNWDENSNVSLKRNIRSISVLIPEWMQLQSNLTFNSSEDKSVIALTQAHNVKVMPLINNYINNKFDSDILHRLFKNPDAENRLIQQMLGFIKKNHFSGINIDFEAIYPKDQNRFTQFINKLAAQFHQNGLQVTLDVPPDDPAFDYEALSKAVDRMIVMLYDEHYETSQPGPIASMNWINHSLDNLDIPSSKLIVSLGVYGYDWIEHSSRPADPVTFGDLMDMSLNAPLNIQWDHAAENPYLRYKDGKDQHIVWFLDAATFYNQLKVSIEDGSKGVAIWRLGSEDVSIWKLINKSKAMEDPTQALSGLENPNSVHYSGNGEVLKIVSSSKDGKRELQTDNNGSIVNEEYETFPKPFEVMLYGKPKRKEVALTFDDGPDPVYTPQILDILDQNHIKGSFFIVGENAELHPEIIERLFKEGHEIGSHTFTHPNVASISPIRTKMELNANQRLFQEITGHSMTMFRPPYAADAEPSTPNELLPILRAQSLGYTMIGELIDPEDWQRPSSQKIVNRILKQLPNGNVILLHDAGGNRSATVAALPQIIKALKQRGYTFTTIGDLIGKSKEDIMPSAIKDRPYLVYDKAMFNVIRDWSDGLTILFYSAIILGIIRLALLVTLSRRQVKRYKEIPVDLTFIPPVSVVIAAYNEEKVIGKTIDSILKSDYPAFEIIIVDDGSKDGTASIVTENYKGDNRVHLITKPNGGKSSAINRGFQDAKGEIVVAMDADTLISHDAISLLVRHFKDEKVAAVSGNVKVGNIGNLLSTWQHIEYVTGFNLERRAFAELNCITVVPGAIGAWKREAVKQVGFFKEDTLAEDTDITLTLLRQGYKIEFEEKAYAYTEVPEDLKSLAKQRTRWTYGTLQCLWKHRGAIFSSEHKTLGFIGLPNMWIFQYLYQSIAPIADILFILALFGNDSRLATIGFLLFYLMDFLTSLYAFRLERENPKPLISLFLQRILYKQLMTYVVLKSIISAIRGVTVGWNKLKRNGNVSNQI